MTELIAHVTGIITSSTLEEPADQLKFQDPERWVELKNKNKLTLPFYQYFIDQHTGEGQPLQFKVKDYETDKPMLPPFSNFDEQCSIRSWMINKMHGLVVKPTDLTIKKVSMSFEDDSPLGKEDKSPKSLKKVG